MPVTLWPTPNTVYKTEIKIDTDDNKKRYLGSSKIPFKRHRKHARNFKHEYHEMNTVFLIYLDLKVWHNNNNN